jgi:hypothetical protein
VKGQRCFSERKTKVHVDATLGHAPFTVCDCWFSPFPPFHHVVAVIQEKPRVTVLPWTTQQASLEATCVHYSVVSHLV